MSKCENVITISNFAYFMRLNESNWRFVLSQFCFEKELKKLTMMRLNFYNALMEENE